MKPIGIVVEGGLGNCTVLGNERNDGMLLRI